MITKEDAPRLIMEAERNNRLYKIKTPWRVFYLIFGIVCFLLIFTIPFGIIMLMLYFKPCIAIAEEAVVIKWIGTRVIKWDDFGEFRLGKTHVYGNPALGLAVNVAANMAASVLIKGPLQYTLKGNEIWHNIAVHVHNRSAEIVEEFEKRTGQSILPLKK